MKAFTLSFFANLLLCNLAPSKEESALYILVAAASFLLIFFLGLTIKLYKDAK